jgi:nitrogen fixation NifU-like protein
MNEPIEPSAHDDLYREVLLDHHRRPRGQRPIARVDAMAQGRNASCGDELSVELELEGETIRDVAVRCRGCAISVAAGSMLAELVRGRSRQEARGVARGLQRLLRGEAPDPELELGDLEALAGVRRFPARIKCAALSGVTLLAALEERAERDPEPATEPGPQQVGSGGRHG